MLTDATLLLLENQQIAICNLSPNESTGPTYAHTCECVCVCFCVSRESFVDPHAHSKSQQRQPHICFKQRRGWTHTHKCVCVRPLLGSSVQSKGKPRCACQAPNPMGTNLSLHPTIVAIKSERERLAHTKKVTEVL